LGGRVRANPRRAPASSAAQPVTTTADCDRQQIPPEVDNDEEPPDWLATTSFSSSVSNRDSRQLPLCFAAILSVVRHRRRLFCFS